MRRLETKLSALTVGKWICGIFLFFGALHLFGTVGASDCGTLEETSEFLRRFALSTAQTLISTILLSRIRQWIAETEAEIAEYREILMSWYQSHPDNYPSGSEFRPSSGRLLGAARWSGGQVSATFCSWLEQHKIPYVQDRDMTIWVAVDGQWIPTQYFIDRKNGKIEFYAVTA